jgi:hypothetical protein
LQKAIERGRLTITEVSEAGSVPYLKAVNKGPWPVLIFDGEELVGAKQNRIVNTTILVGVGETILPVSCVEQGRWSHRTHVFAAGGWASHPRLRREKELQVRAALASAPDSSAGAPGPQVERAQRYRADQGAVWHEVARQSRDLGVHSPTSAMSDAYRHRTADLDDIVAGFTGSQDGASGARAPVKDMVGVAVFLDDTFLCLDVLWSRRRFRELYPKLLRGYALEAARSRTGKVGSAIDPEAEVLRLFAGLSAAAPVSQPAVDLGTDLRLETERVRAVGLACEGEMLQLSAFPR